MKNSKQEKTIEWDNRIIRLSYNPNYLSIAAHLEIQSEDGEPLPITETGYRSHFFMPDVTHSLNDVVQFSIEWINSEAKLNAWQTYITRSKQMELF